jgi:hypothetical protein
MPQSQSPDGGFGSETSSYASDGAVDLSILDWSRFQTGEEEFVRGFEHSHRSQGSLSVVLQHLQMGSFSLEQVYLQEKQLWTAHARTLHQIHMPGMQSLPCPSDPQLYSLRAHADSSCENGVLVDTPVLSRLRLGMRATGPLHCDQALVGKSRPARRSTARTAKQSLFCDFERSPSESDEEEDGPLGCLQITYIRLECWST